MIQSIERTYQAVDDDDADAWEVVVEYTVDGKTYVSDLGQTKDSFAVGKEIDILYDPSEPEVIVLQGKTFWIIGMIAGAVAAAVLLIKDIHDR